MIRNIIAGTAVTCSIGLGYSLAKRDKKNENVHAAAKSHPVKQAPFELKGYSFPDTSEFSLKQVNIVFRHGARTPLVVPPYWKKTEYKVDLLDHPEQTQVPHKLTSMKGEEPPESKVESAYRKRGLLLGGSAPGQLTNIGATQMHTLGESLRKIYIDELGFLQPVHSEEEVYVRTTNMKRTLESARCVVAGLLHIPDDAPITIYTVDANDEIIYPNFYACPRLKTLSRHYWEDPDVIPELKKEREEVQEKMGISTDDHKLHLVEVRDCLAAEHVHGITDNHPEENVIRRIEKAAVRIMHAAVAGGQEEKQPGVATPLSLRLGIGPLIDHIITNMDDEKSKKMNMFSGHDTSIIPLLSAMGLWDTRWPYYGSSVSFELWSNKSEESFVRVLYNGKALTVKGCDGSMCPLTQFKSAMKDIRLNPLQYQTLCSVDDDLNSEKQPKIPGVA